MSDEITKKVSDLEKRVEKLEQMFSPAAPKNQTTPPRRSQTSVVEFLREKKPTSAVEKALTFAVYHENQSGKDVFSADDILSLWRQAKETLPTNVNDLINKNIKKGLIAEEKAEKGQRKCWYVTSSGIEVVNKGFTA